MVRIRLWLCTLVIAIVCSPAAAQDPLKVAPKAYKMEIENDWVRVVRVHYGPREKIPGHYHTERPAAYVYLNDSGPVIFKHKDLPYGDITRPPTKAGGFRLYKSVKEVHAVENKSDIPSDFLRVEFKTDPVNENSLRGKFYREEHPPGENFRKVQFENEQVRITRIVIAPKKTVNSRAGGTEPALVISLTPSRLKIDGKNSPLEPGKTRWMKAGESPTYENTGSSPAEVLLFEFKTKPFNDPKDRTGSQPAGHKH